MSGNQYTGGKGQNCPLPKAASSDAIDSAGEVFTVTLATSEAEALRARAAAHAVTPEAEIIALVDAAIQRQQVPGRKP